MPESKYILRYLPLFYGDVEEKLSYIAFDLNNPKAANELLNMIENAILERLPFAESFGKYFTHKERHYPYYRIFVKNFVIYYVVIHDKESGSKIMEVRRFLYKTQDISRLL